MVTAALAIAGCDVTRLALGSALGVARHAQAAVEQESDPALAEAAAPAGIAQLEGFYQVLGDDPRLVEPLAAAFCGLGAGFEQDHWEEATLVQGDLASAAAHRDRVRLLLGRCGAWAQRLLPAGLATLFEAEDDDEAARRLAGARRADVPGLYWLATAHAATLGVDPRDVALAGLLPRMIAVLDRVVVLDEGFDHGGAHLLLGVLHGAQSAALGGDPARAAAHFARVRALTGDRALLVDVLEARTLAVSRRDGAAFDRLLRRALTTPPAVWPAQRLANELAQRKARRYVRARARFF